VNGNNVSGSVMDASINKPKVQRLGQCRAKGSRARSVIDGVSSFSGCHARQNFWSEGQLDAIVSMSDWVISTGWSWVSSKALEVIKSDDVRT
jgi:hypothetical protein